MLQQMQQQIFHQILDGLHICHMEMQIAVGRLLGAQEGQDVSEQLRLDEEADGQGVAGQGQQLLGGILAQQQIAHGQLHIGGADPVPGAAPDPVQQLRIVPAADRGAAFGVAVQGHATARIPPGLPALAQGPAQQLSHLPETATPVNSTSGAP